MLKQSLQQKLSQKLSPLQIQLMKLLQLPTIALEQRIKEEIEINPALEEGKDETDENDMIDDFGDEKDNSDERDEAIEEFDFSDYMDEDEIPAYKLSIKNSGKDVENKEIPLIAGKSFHDLLLAQLLMQSINEEQKEIAEYLIGNIDDAGYLRRELSSIVDDLAFTQNMTTTEEELLSLLKIIQEFDPAGIGARNLQECLLLQLNRKPNSNKTINNARLILENYFNEFTKKHYNKIIEKMEISEGKLKNAIDEILKLNPKPGNSLGETDKINQEIIPDFTITTNNGELELTLNTRNAPELKISKTYSNLIKQYQHRKTKPNKSQKDTLMFVKQKLDSAKWFIDAIKQRQETLLITMTAIIKYQKDYFLKGDETLLKPMILKNIAEVVNLDISTISRVANSKYVQTPYGIFSLKYFFSESLATKSGEEVSTREVKKILQDCIDVEDKKKPVTDEKLGRILREKGYQIARRTVAKYREQLNIPVARLRREL